MTMILSQCNWYLGKIYVMMSQPFIAERYLDDALEQNFKAYQNKNNVYLSHL